MKTDELDDGPLPDGAGPAPVSYGADGRPFLPRAGGVPVTSSLADDDEDLLAAMFEGSSNWPAGVRRRPPSGLKVNLRKKFVKLSSP